MLVACAGNKHGKGNKHLVLQHNTAINLDKRICNTWLKTLADRIMIKDVHTISHLASMVGYPCSPLRILTAELRWNSGIQEHFALPPGASLPTVSMANNKLLSRCLLMIYYQYHSFLSKKNAPLFQYLYNMYLHVYFSVQPTKMLL